MPQKKPSALRLADPRRRGKITDSDPRPEIPLRKPAHCRDMRMICRIRVSDPVLRLQSELHQFQIQHCGKPCKSALAAPLRKPGHTVHHTESLHVKPEKRALQPLRRITERGLFRTRMNDHMRTGDASRRQTERKEFADPQQTPFPASQNPFSAFTDDLYPSRFHEQTEMVALAARCHEPRRAVVPPVRGNRRQRLAGDPLRHDKIRGQGVLRLRNAVFISVLIHDRFSTFNSVFRYSISGIFCYNIDISPLFARRD